MDLRVLVLLAILMMLFSACIQQPEETSTTSSTSTTTTSTSTTTTTTSTTPSTTTTLPVLKTSMDVRIAGYQFESPYKPEKSFLSEEWVVLKNTGNYTVNLTGWRIRNKNYKHTFILPEFYLKPGASVKVHTGEGLNSEEDIYMNWKDPVWDNEVDVITVFDSELKIIEKLKGLARLDYSID